MRTFLGVLLVAFFLSASDLPELPQVNTSGFLTPIRAQIQAAAAQARAHPHDAKAAGELAMTLHAYQQYDAAERAYSRAHLLEPESFDWLYLLGAVQKARGAFDAAIQQFRAALHIRPDDLAAKLRLVESYTASASWEEAGVLSWRMVDQYRDLPQAWYQLGRVQAGKGDHASAAQSYARACELFPPYGAAHFALAAELRKLGQAKDAEQHLALYSKNATVEPPLDDPLFQGIRGLNHSITAHLRLGAELEQAGKFEDAIREHEAALATDPNNVQVHINLISLYARAGNLASAKQNFETAIQLSPGRSDAWYNYGVLLFHEKDYAGAEKSFRRALGINPNYAEAHNNLGVIHEQHGHLDDAAREFREAIAARPDFPLARFHLGRILVNQEKYTEAIQHFRRALEPESDQTPSCLYALGATYARAGDRQHALEYLAKAHDSAIAHSQTKLQTSIDRDLKMLQAQQ
jgi:tetratricopeptide (TPR) repeat protein